MFLAVTVRQVATGWRIAQLVMRTAAGSGSSDGHRSPSAQWLHRAHRNRSLLLQHDLSTSGRKSRKYINSMLLPGHSLPCCCSGGGGGGASTSVEGGGVGALGMSAGQGVAHECVCVGGVGGM